MHHKKGTKIPEAPKVHSFQSKAQIWLNTNQALVWLLNGMHNKALANRVVLIDILFNWMTSANMYYPSTRQNKKLY